jgi:adenylate cyclase
LSPTADRLVIAAEREAVRLAAVVRSVVASLLLLLFTFRRPPGLPPGLVALVQLGLMGNIAVAALSWWIARWPRGWRSGTFFVLSDFVIVIGATAGTLHLMQLPPSMFAATPAFLLAVPLLSFAALRYSPWSVALLTLGIIGTALVLTALPATGPLAELPLFSPAANSFRIIMLTATGAVLTYVVLRGRRLLVEAVSVGERAANLSRYLPPPVADLVAEQGIEALSRGRSQDAAVLFADIVGFTTLTEQMPPEEVGSLLTELRSQQLQAVEQAGGIVDKFIGDAVMAVFGVPEPDPAAASRALEAAASIRQSLAAWNRQLVARGRPALAVGIGVHYGRVFAGAVGDARRLEFATLGDTVNVAQRCEHLTRELGADMIVTGDTLRAAGVDLAAWVPIPARALRGRHGAVELFHPAA